MPDNRWQQEAERHPGHGGGLDNQSARCISELKASALLWLWYELAIHGAPQNNHAQARERIDTDYQRLKKLIWSEGDS
ncbi:hypothetical protein NDG50_004532 [Salmonella enterica]|nr:hypothetical protein [Salmonella enterica]